MSDKPRLLWHSNAPFTSTGYGQQTALFTSRLAEHYELWISSFYGLEGNRLGFEKDIIVLPGISGTYGNETLPEHAQVFFGSLRGGLVVTLMDVWVLDPAVLRTLDVACWVPIDHEPCPPPIAQVFRSSGAIPIAMSKFGQEQLEEFNPLYVPHAVNCDLYKPVPRKEARKTTGMPQEPFIVGMVAANKGNPSRKCFSEAFQAFKAFHETHRDSKLYIHSELTGRFDGVNLPQLLDAVGLDKNAVIFCDQYRALHMPFSAQLMAAMYSSLDVLLMPSAGEGFGIPAVEAQACGTPVIVSDFSAQPELCGSGWLVSGHRFYTPLKAWQFHPDVEDIHDALRQAYAQSDNMAKKAREHALNYHVDKVMEDHMLPALEEARERLDERKPMKLEAVAA